MELNLEFTVAENANGEIQTDSTSEQYIKTVQVDSKSQRFKRVVHVAVHRDSGTCGLYEWTVKLNSTGRQYMWTVQANSTNGQ